MRASHFSLLVVGGSAVVTAEPEELSEPGCERRLRGPEVRWSGPEFAGREVGRPLGKRIVPAQPARVEHLGPKGGDPVCRTSGHEVEDLDGVLEQPDLVGELTVDEELAIIPAPLTLDEGHGDPLLEHPRRANFTP